MPTLPAALTGYPGEAVNQGKPPSDEIGTAHQVAAPGGWAAFLDEAEYVPELTFPQSVIEYHRMRSDTQIEALHLGTTQPVREYRWMIEPNGAPKGLVEDAATDLGLPVRGEEDEDGNVRRAAAKFDFDCFLQDVLLAPLYGFMDFEIVGTNSPDDGWRMSKLAPRHPRTIQQFKEGDHGELEAIKQIFAPRMGMTPPPIPASSLVHFAWRPEAGNFVGRSMLRSMYREWLVKERVMRITPVNIERGGGVPVIEGPQGASNKQLEELANMARQFKVAQGGGGSIPFGSKLNLVSAGVPESISLLTYCDEAMARVWALMLIQLGQTATGSRALGGEFAIYAARAQRLMGGWVAATVNDFLDRYVEWNDPLADYAPRLVFEPPSPEGLSVTDLVALLDAGALTVDPELEEWLRKEFALPAKPEAPEHEDLGELTPDEVALVQNARNPPALPGAGEGGKRPPPNPDFIATPGPKKVLDPTVIMPTIASGDLTLPRLHRGIRASLTLPERPLRRPPSANEIRAAVDFAGLDRDHAAAVAALHHDYINGTLPAQIDHLADQIRMGAKPSELRAPIVAHERLVEHLQAAARSGVQSGIREAQVQGVHFAPSQIADAHDVAARRAAEQAEHVATLNANGLSLGAQRRAGRLTNAVRSREKVAKDLESHLSGQKHVFERENLKGAITMAQNSGRIAAFGTVAPEQATAIYEASEILDDRTCGPCEAIDGTTYDDLSEAEADYAAGGYVDCEGGPNCRGTLVAVYGEQNPETGEGPLGEAEPSTIPPSALDELGQGMA